ncbi:MAG: PEGA domain-containing protein [Deltaproteobacteria bacterium]|nr:PEGA domain-containing protein [Deltaproteobacteria bacterium]
MPAWIASVLICAADPAIDRRLVVLDASLEQKDEEAAAAFAVLGGGGNIIRADSASDPELDEQRKLVKLALDTVKSARKAALELRTDEAIQKFEEAQNLFGRGISALDEFTPMAQSLIDLGAAFIDARKDDKATNAFRRALALGAGVKPDPKVYNPEVLSRFSKVEREMVRAARGSMTIVSKPEGAEVYFDGRRAGLTPVSLNDLLLGEHWIVVRLAGHHRFSARVVVSKERVEKTEVFLRTLPPQASPLVKLIEGARRAPLDQELAKEALKVHGAKSLVLVLAGEPMRAIYFDEKTGERAASGRTLDALGKALKSALSSPAPIVEPAKDPGKKDAPVVVKQAPPDDRPIALKNPSARRTVHWAVAMLPAGIGQFAENRIGMGVLFLTTQVLFLTANILGFYLVQMDKVPGTSPPEFGNPQRSEAFKWISNIGLGLLLADVILGGVDGILHRNAE